MGICNDTKESNDSAFTCSVEEICGRAKSDQWLGETKIYSKPFVGGGGASQMKWSIFFGKAGAPSNDDAFLVELRSKEAAAEYIMENACYNKGP